MIKHVEVYARHEGSDIVTKKFLIITMRDNPGSISFTPVSGYNSDISPFKGDNVPKNHDFHVVGPNPYNRRIWYANVINHGSPKGVKVT